MSLSVKAWVGIGFAIAAVVAAIVTVLVLLVFNSKITDIRINHARPLENGKTTYTNGSKLTLEYIGRGVKTVDWSYSIDGGTNFIGIVTGVSSTHYIWSIPPSIYSDTVLVRVISSNKTNIYKDSRMFKVTPSLHLTTAAKTLEKYVIPGNLEIHYDTNSSLITADNLKLKISTDGGTTYTDPSEDDTYVVIPSQKYIQWNVSSDLDGTTLNIQLTTDGLVEEGYPAEIIAKSFGKIQLTSNNTSGHSSKGGVFDTFHIYGDSNFTQIVSALFEGVSYLTFGEKIYLNFALEEGVDPLTENDIALSYAITAKGGGQSQWIKVTDLITENESLNRYSWVIPSIGVAEATITFRLQQINADVSPLPEVEIAGINIESFLHVIDTGTGEPRIIAYDCGDSTGHCVYGLEIYSVELGVDPTLGQSGWSIDVVRCGDSTPTTYTQDIQNFISISTSEYILEVKISNLDNMNRIQQMQLKHTVGDRVTETRLIPIRGNNC